MNKFKEHYKEYNKDGKLDLTAFPEIKKLQSLDALKDLQLKKTTDLGIIILFEYEAKGPKLFPYVKQSLMDNGFAKRHNIISTTHTNMRTKEETYGLHIGFYGSKLQIFLDIKKH